MSESGWACGPTASFSEGRCIAPSAVLMSFFVAFRANIDARARSPKAKLDSCKCLLAVSIRSITRRLQYLYLLLFLVLTTFKS